MPITGWTPMMKTYYVGDNANRTFTEQVYTEYPTLSHTITVLQPSYAYIWSQLNGRNDQARNFAAAIGAFCDDTQIWPSLLAGQVVAGVSMPMMLSVRSLELDAGEHTIDVRVYVYNAGDTYTMRYASLTVFVIPSSLC